MIFFIFFPEELFIFFIFQIMLMHFVFLQYFVLFMNWEEVNRFNSSCFFNLYVSKNIDVCLFLPRQKTKIFFVETLGSEIQPGIMNICSFGGLSRFS